MININNYYDKYFYVFSDCFITNGAKRFSILDVSRQKIYFLNSDYYVLFEMMSKDRIGKIIECFESNEDIENFCQFIQKLLEQDLGLFVDDISLFPPIEMKWETPSWITNQLLTSDIFSMILK